MKIKIIKKNKCVVRKISRTYKVKNFLTKDLTKNISLAIGEATKHSEITKNIRSDRIYYVLRGKLLIKKGNKKFIAKPGDVIYISRNTQYNFEGTFKAILINSPAFDSKDERILES